MTKNVDFTSAVAAKMITLREGNTYDTGKVCALAKSIMGRSATLDIDIHAAAMGALHTAAAHNDATAMERVVNALGRAARAKALVAWATHYTNVRLTYDKKASHFTAKLCATDERLSYEALMDKAVLAMAKPFWSVDEKDTDASAFDDAAFAVAVAKLIKRASDANAKLSPEAQAALADLRVMNVKLAPAEPAKGAVDPLTMA